MPSIFIFPHEAIKHENALKGSEHTILFQLNKIAYAHNKGLGTKSILNNGLYPLLNIVGQM